MNVLLENIEAVAGWNWIDGVMYEEAVFELRFGLFCWGFAVCYVYAGVGCVFEWCLGRMEEIIRNTGCHCMGFLNGWTFWCYSWGFFNQLSRS